MPLRVLKMQRFQSTDRNEFALAALQACRVMRARPQISSAQYFWVDSGNTLAIVVQGQPGCFDYDPEGNAEVGKAFYALHDMGSLMLQETWADAGAGQESWARAGSPSGTR